MPSFASSSATASSTAWSRLSRRSRVNHSLAVRQSGTYWKYRHLEYILALRTRPVMIASRHPAARSVRIHCPSRKTPTHLNESTSVSRSSRAFPASPQQTTLRPAARAPRATCTGNAPASPISPSGCAPVGWALRTTVSRNMFTEVTMPRSFSSKQPELLLTRVLPRRVHQLRHLRLAELLDDPLRPLLQLVIHLLLVQRVQRVEVDQLLLPRAQLIELLVYQHRRHHQHAAQVRPLGKRLRRVAVGTGVPPAKPRVRLVRHAGPDLQPADRPVVRLVLARLLVHRPVGRQADQQLRELEVRQLRIVRHGHRLVAHPRRHQRVPVALGRRIDDVNVDVHQV